MPFVSKALAQTLQLQSIAMEAATIIASDLADTKDRTLRTRQAQSLASLAKAFDTLEDRKRILKGKPMPGSLRPEGPKTKRKQRKSLHSFATEPEHVDPPAPAPENPEGKESLLPPSPSTEGTGGGGLG